MRKIVGNVFYRIRNTITSPFVRRFIGLAVFLVSGGIAAVICIWSVPKVPTEQRIGWTQVAVDVVGFIIAIFAILLAGYEFELSQRKPDLNLTFQLPDGSFTDTAVFRRPPDHEWRGYNLRVILKNSSDGVGESVKVEVDFQDLDDPPSCPPLKHGLAEHHKRYRDLWRFEDRGPNRIEGFFRGGGDFVMSPNDDKEPIGEFTIFVLQDGPSKECPVPFSIRARGIDKKSGQLMIRIESE